MKFLKIRRLIIIDFLWVVWLTSCVSIVDTNLKATTIPEEAAPPLQGGQVRQWGIEAEASSEFGDPEWAAQQATGTPATPRWGDYQTAWATAGSDKIETLELIYPVSLHVTGVNIVQSFNPNQVVLVELVGDFDRAITVYDSQPAQVDQPCPYTLSIPIEKTDRRYSKIRITVDQSILGLGWNQIDAVEMIGDTD